MTHEEKVKKLLIEFNKAKGKVALKKKTTHLFRRLEKATHRLDVSSFTEVLSINDAVVEVEGMTTMEKLATETLKKGFVPEVVIELKSITVGGAVSGIAIESSSFKFGLFHESVLEMEVLVPTGEIIVCSREKNQDLFHALPNSYGTLGYILKLKIKLIKAKKYVKMQYLKYDDIKKCMDDLEKFSSETEKYNFVDGAVFGRNDLVIALGMFTDDAPYVSDYTYMKIYYKSLKDKTEDYLTTKNFLFRWDTDWWWETKDTPLQNKIVRFILGRRYLNSKFYMNLFHLEKKYKFFNKVPYISSKTESVIQDIGIPRVNWEKYLDFLLTDIKILPIWLCPFKGSSEFILFPLENKIYLDFGFWGSAPTKEDKGKWNRLVEQKTFEMKGIKSLYSEVTYTKEEFWRNSNEEEYEKVKKKYDPQGKLKSLYEKVANK